MNLAQGRYPIVDEGLLRVQCKVINFRLNSNLTPFYNDLKFKLKCKLVVCLFLISILLTFDYSS